MQVSLCLVKVASPPSARPYNCGLDACDSAHQEAGLEIEFIRGATKPRIRPLCVIVREIEIFLGRAEGYRCPGIRVDDNGGGLMKGRGWAVTDCAGADRSIWALEGGERTDGGEGRREHGQWRCTCTCGFGLGWGW